MKFKNIRIKLFFFAVILSAAFFCLPANANNSNQTINVNLTVPSAVPPPGGGGGGTTDNPPVISNIVVSNITHNSASVSWDATDDHGIVGIFFYYGTSVSYGSTALPAQSGNHYTVDLSGLNANTPYYFAIQATDIFPHTVTSTGSFTTLPVPIDNIAPNITNIVVVPGITTATIYWDTNELADSQVQYGLNTSYGGSYFDTNRVLSHTSFITDLIPNTFYHFRLISTDAAGNATSTGDLNFTTHKDNIPPPDVTGLRLTTTTNSITVYWINPSIIAVPDFDRVVVLRKAGSASANISDGSVVYIGSDEDFVDNSPVAGVVYYYTIFSYDTSNNHSPGVYIFGHTISPSAPPVLENCVNGVDDNANGLIDCLDPECFSFVGCLPIPPTSTPPGPVNPPTPTSTPSGPSSPTTTPTPPPEHKIGLSDVSFFAPNKNLKLTPVNGVVSGLSGVTLIVEIPKSAFSGTPKDLSLKIENETHNFVFDAQSNSYFSSFSFSVGQAAAVISVDYGDNKIESVTFIINGLSNAYVSDNTGSVLPQTTLFLYKGNGDLADLIAYGESNPFVTGADGSYGWMVPNGDYYITINKDGYFSRTIAKFNVKNNVIAVPVNLIYQPKKLADVIKPNAPIAENVKNVVVNLTEKATAIIEVGQQIIESPQAQTAAQTAAPTAVTIAAAITLPFLSWMDLLPFLRLLFFQPLILLGWRKREKWGLVYNSLNKQPIDLAIVRLIDVNTDKVVQSRVTDSMGRYFFLAEEGDYILQVHKSGFSFPSLLLEGFSSDGQRTDIYHGEKIVVEEKNAAITANIPMDPVGAVKKPARLVWEKIGRRAQTIIAWVGGIVTAISLYISPKWYIAALLVLHIVLFVVFRRLSKVSKAKGWGIVYDASDKKPIGRVVARLFNAQFNKLVATQVTDNKGKYLFIAGDDKYYVVYDHKDYKPLKTDIIDLTGKKSEAISVDVPLKHD